MTSIAVLGTGTMGAAMARSLLRGGVDVRVWNRSQGRAAPLADGGATVAGSPAEAVRGADLVLTMLFDTDAVLGTLREAADGLSGDQVLLQASTVGPDGIASIAQLAERSGWALLDTPVLGTKQPAEDGALTVLASGDPALRDAAQPAFDAIGSRTVWAGDRIGAASALKLACNSWVAAITAATAQSLVLARGAGIDPALVLDALTGGGSDSPYLHLKGEAMINGDFDPAFAVDGILKDVRLMAALADGSGVGHRLIDAVADLFAAASEHGHGHDDIAAVITAF